MRYDEQAERPLCPRCLQYHDTMEPEEVVACVEGRCEAATPEVLTGRILHVMQCCDEEDEGDGWCMCAHVICEIIEAVKAVAEAGASPATRQGGATDAQALAALPSPHL